MSLFELSYYLESGWCNDWGGQELWTWRNWGVIQHFNRPGLSRPTMPKTWKLSDQVFTSHVFHFFLQSSVTYHNPTKRISKRKILPLSWKIRQSCICQLAARCARMMMRGQNEWLAGRRKWIWYQEVEPQDCQIVSQLGINVPQTDNEGPVLYCALIVLLLSSSPNKRDFRDVFVRIFYSNYSTQTFPS